MSLAAVRLRAVARAMPTSGGAGLTATLDEIWRSGLPLAERRRLCARVALGFATTPSSTASSQKASALEEILSAVGCSCSLGRRATISEAKQLLRGHEADAGTRLAAKLGKLSKLRNSEVHDANNGALLSEVRFFLANYGDKVRTELMQDASPADKVAAKYQPQETAASIDEHNLLSDDSTFDC